MASARMLRQPVGVPSKTQRDGRGGSAIQLSGAGYASDPSPAIAGLVVAALVALALGFTLRSE